MNARVLRYIIQICCWLLSFNADAAVDDGIPKWTQESIEYMGNMPPLFVPKIQRMNYANMAINILSDANKWIDTTLRVGKGKKFGLEWYTQGIHTTPRRYRVFYRLDPRFKRPVVYISKYLHDSRVYRDDFSAIFKTNEPRRDKIESIQKTISLYVDYVHFQNMSERQVILVKKGETISITLMSKVDFKIDNAVFDAVEKYRSDLPPGLRMHGVTNLWLENQVIKVDAKNFCAAFSGKLNTTICRPGSDGNMRFIHGNGVYGAFPESNLKIVDSDIVYMNLVNNNITKLSAVVKADGEEMEIKLGGQIIKYLNDKFLTRSNTRLYPTFYYVAQESGPLDFMWDDRLQIVSKKMDDTNGKIFENSINEASLDTIYFGNYLMEVEIGGTLMDSTPQDVKLEFLVSEQNPNQCDNDVVDSVNKCVNKKGADVRENYEGDGQDDGRLWVRVINTNKYSGMAIIKSTSYTGSQKVSDIINTWIIENTIGKYSKIVKRIYQSVIENKEFRIAIKVLLTLYIVLMMIYLLLGQLDLSPLQIVTRLFKVSLIVILIDGNQSWGVYSQYIFDVFTQVPNDLIIAVVGNSSSSANSKNVFGFLDVIWAQVVNKDLWVLLLIQLVQFWNGLTFFAFITIWGLITFLVSTIEVVVVYIISFVAIYILISLFPLFLLFILFERTKNMTFQWINAMFRFALSPTLVIMFYLIIYQILTSQLSNAVVGAKWTCILPLRIKFRIPVGLDIDIPIPYINCIYFWVSDIGQRFRSIIVSSIVFYALVKITENARSYIESIAGSLTSSNISTGAEGKRPESLQYNPNPETSIIKDIINPETSFVSPETVKGAINLAYGKMTRVGYKGAKSIANAGYKGAKSIYDRAQKHFAKGVEENKPDVKESGSADKLIGSKDTGKQSGISDKNIEGKKSDVSTSDNRVGVINDKNNTDNIGALDNGSTDVSDVSKDTQRTDNIESSREEVIGSDDGREKDVTTKGGATTTLQSENSDDEAL